jgi:hypothetical protein
MESLIIRSIETLSRTNFPFQRYLMQDIHWDWRLIGIKGARGTGKTTMMLQYLKQKYGAEGKGLYLSLDDIYFTENPLVMVIEQLRAKGYQAFFLDEVHKYPTWAREIKNLYDRYPDILIVFTGSSLIEMNKLDVDLSRRSVVYELQGLSFREYLSLVTQQQFSALKLDDLLERHTMHALSITAQTKPLQYFSMYLREGYYPFFIEDQAMYLTRLAQTIQLVVETDLNFIEGIQTKQIRKILQLLLIIATSVPFKPNIAKLAERIGIERNTLLKYLHFLEKAAIVRFLDSEGKGISILQKPDKIYLENTNISYALAPGNVDIGNLRETFFFNQTSKNHLVQYTDQGDFRIDGQYVFEVGGRNKTAGQIKGIANAWLAVDQIETGIGNRIPLWLFGFLY